MPNFITRQTNYINARALRDEAELDYIKKREKLRILQKEKEALERIDEELSPEKQDDYDLLSDVVTEEGSVAHAFAAYETAEDNARITYESLADFSPHKTLINNLDDKFPILLFPLRVETKFSLQNNKYFLKVRIFPDIVHTENHEPLLTEDEEADSAAYFEADTEEKQTAWNTLALKHGSQRAAYIVSLGDPEDFDLQSSSWVRQAEARTLPDKFVVSVYFKSQASNEYEFKGDVEGDLISDRVKLSINPNDEDTAELDLTKDDELEFSGSIKWLADYGQAEEDGMAITIDLETLDNTLTKTVVEDGEIKLVVLGVKVSADATLGKTLLEDLINDHHYTDVGMSILQIGQRTHNTSASDSSFTTKDIGNRRSYNTEIETDNASIKEIFANEPDFEEQTDGQRLADALGIDHETLFHIENAKGKDIKNALKFNKMLWRATLGYKLEYGLLDIFSPASIEETRKFFTKHVAGRGMLPSIRINEQAYGILPASAFSEWQWAGSEPNKTWLDKYTNTVNSLSESIATYTAAKKPVSQGGNPQQSVIEAFGNNPTSTDIYHRYAMGPDFTWNMLSAQNKMGNMSAWLNSINSKAAQVMQNLGFPMQSPDRMMKLTYMNQEGKYIGALVQDGKRGKENPLKPIEGTNINYLKWLAMSSFTEILNEDFSNIEATTTTPPDSLLYKLARKAILEEYRNSALKLAEAYPAQLEIDRKITEFVNIPEPYRYDVEPPEPSVSLDPPPPQETFISGTVTNGETMFPLANTNIYIISSEGLQTVTTDSLGNFSYVLFLSFTENVHFKIQKEGFFSFSQTEVINPGMPLILSLVLYPLNISPTQVIVEGESFLSIMETERNFVINNIPYTGTLHNYIDNQGNAELWNSSLEEARACLDYCSMIAVVDLEWLLREHMDLGSYRLDAWQHGMVHQRIQKNRGISGFEKGIYLGGYGFVEELKPKTNKQTVSVSLPNLIGNIEKSVLGGYVHTPSPNHASAAAILKSGYLNQESTNDDAKKINLTSERVRLALKFINGVKAGQTLPALLGYEFERGLSERHSSELNLNQFIYDFRESFPAEAINEDSEEVEKSFILNGWRLYTDTRKDPNAEFPYGKGFLEEIDKEVEDAIEEELDRLADVFDAISDVCLAEAVYCMVGNNYEKAGAIMDALKTGNLLSHEFDFLKTPLSGSVLTQKIALMIDEDSYEEIFDELELVPVWAGSEVTHRQKLEPYINKIISGLIPNPQDIKCKVYYTIPDEEKEDLIFNLGMLGLQALDYVHLFPDELNNDQSELSRLIRRQVKADAPTFPHNTLIEIDYASAGEDDLTFQEFLPLIKRVRNLIAGSRALKAEDFIDPNSNMLQDAEPEYDLAEFYDRVNNLKDDYNSAIGNLQTKINALEIKGENFETELNNLRNEISKAWQFNILDAIVDDYVSETGTEAKTAMLSQGETVLEVMKKKEASVLSLFNQLTFVEEEYEPKNEDIKTLQEIARIVYGDAFVSGPLFGFQNKDEMGNALSASPSLIDNSLDEELEISKWLHGLSKVRLNIREFDLVNAVSENLFDLKNPMHPVQLPYVEDEKWIAISQEGANYDNDKSSIVISYGYQAEADSTVRKIDPKEKQAGLLIDEWVELIPSKEETTGVAFNFDQPDTQPPNSILFTVPHQETGNWNWQKLLKAVNETFYLAKQRTVSPDEISQSALGIVNKLIDQYNKLNPNIVNSARIDEGVTTAVS